MSSRTATLIGLTAILMWSLLSVLTVATGTIPAFQLMAMTFAIGALAAFASFPFRPRAIAAPGVARCTSHAARAPGRPHARGASAALPCHPLAFAAARGLTGRAHGAAAAIRNQESGIGAQELGAAARGAKAGRGERVGSRVWARSRDGRVGGLEGAGRTAYGFSPL